MANDKETLRQALGAYGFKEIVGPLTVQDDFIAIKTISATASFSAKCSSGDDLSLVAMPLGDIFNGNFKEITVSSGKVVAYYDVG